MTISYALNEEDLNRINREFIRSYDFKYWLFQLKTNRILVENLDEFVEAFGDETLRDESVEEYKLALQSEVVYNFYHTTEALFSLFIANRVSYLPWRKMRHLGVGQICEFIRDVVLDDGLELEDIRFTFYRGTGENAHEANEQLLESVEFIEQYLKTIGQWFLDHDLYNEYKHGLRVLTSRESIRITDDETGETVLTEDGTVHTYLQSEQIEKDGNDEIHQLIKVSEWFDYDLYHDLCMMNYHLIRQMFDSLQQNQREGDEEGMIDVTLFEHDLENLFDGNGHLLVARQRFPIGENLYELG